MAGGGTETTTQSNTSEPWKEAQPFIKEGLTGAQTAYQSGEGFKAFPGSTVVPFSQQTQSALGGIENIAGQGNPLAGAANTQAQGIIGSGGISPWQMGALGQTYDVATGNRSIGTEGDYRGLLSGASGPGAIESNLSGYASGANVNGGSPEFLKALDTQASRLRDDIDRSVDMQGRGGSDYHVQSLTEGIGNLRTKAIADEVARQQGLQVQSAGMLSGEQSNNLAQRSGLVGQIGQTQGANIANSVGAGQNIFGAGDAGATQAARYAALAPDIYNQQFAPYERLASVGSQYEDLAAREKQDEISKFDSGQQEDWRRLAAYNALVGGAGQLGGTSTGTVTAPRQYNYGAPVGGAIAGGSLFGPVGALGGGALGLLGLL